MLFARPFFDCRRAFTLAAAVFAFHDDADVITPDYAYATPISILPIADATAVLLLLILPPFYAMPYFRAIHVTPLDAHTLRRHFDATMPRLPLIMPLRTPGARAALRA